MKTLRSNFGKILLAGGILFMSACDKDDDTPDDPVEKKTTVKGVFEEEERYSMMNEAVEISNQSSFFSNASANITVFAANNDAFNDLFAEMGVSSMAELQTQMGNEAFANLIMYHAINGKFEVSDFEDGFEETHASSADTSSLSLYIDNESDTRLVFNGNDNNGGATIDNSSISATNGSVIEIDAVLQAQSNYENIVDGKEEHESTMFVNVLTSSESSVTTMLSDENQQSTVLVANDANLQSILSVHLPYIIDEDDLDSILTSTQKSALYASLGVSTTAELLAEVTLNEIFTFTSLTMADIFAEFESADYTELINTCIFSNDYNLEEMASNNGSITSEAGVTFDVSSNTSGNIVLTDTDGNEVVLQGQSAQSVNGSIYTILEVHEM